MAGPRLNPVRLICSLSLSPLTERYPHIPTAVSLALWPPSAQLLPSKLLGLRSPVYVLRHWSEILKSSNQRASAFNLHLSREKVALSLFTSPRRKPWDGAGLGGLLATASQHRMKTLQREAAKRTRPPETRDGLNVCAQDGGQRLWPEAGGTGLWEAGTGRRRTRTRKFRSGCSLGQLPCIWYTLPRFQKPGSLVNVQSLGHSEKKSR